MELKKKYVDVFVETQETVPEGYSRYRIRIGHLPNFTAARDLENQLRRDGLEPFVAPVK